MKKSKIIIPALAMLVMSTAATVTGTVAWFTMNTTATAEGMVVAAKTNGSLIVKEIAATNAALPTNSDKATKVVFANTPHNFYPSTHDLAIGDDTGLRRVYNGQDVNFETGTAMNEGTTLTYVEVAENDNDYYFDYGLFIAGDGMAMNSQRLTFSLSTDTTNMLNMYNALSIDFYGAIVNTATYPDVDSTNYIGTLNIAGKKNTLAVDANLNDGVMRPTGVTTSQTSVYNATAVNIPKNEGNSAYAVRMRVYFDGELIDVAKEGNFYANYVSAGSQGDTMTGNESYLFYSDDQGSSIVEKKNGKSLEGLYKVSGGTTGTSTLTYARSIDVGTFDAQTLNVSISASTVS